MFCVKSIQQGIGRYRRMEVYGRRELEEFYEKKIHVYEYTILCRNGMPVVDWLSVSAGGSRCRLFHGHYLPTDEDQDIFNDSSNQSIKSI